MNLKQLSVILTLIFFSFSIIPVAGSDSPKDDISVTSAKGEVRRWEITGPWGGDVRAMVVAPDNPELFYLGTSDGQIFRSTDSARTWRRLKPGLEKRGLSIDDIVIDPRNTKTIYISAWAVGSNVADQGAFKSEDGGESWALLKDTKGQTVLSVALAPSDSNYVFVGSRAGVLRSTNAGKSFERISPEDNKEIRNINSIAVDPTNINTVYVGTHHLPWKTTDGGQTWKQNGYAKVGLLDDSDIMGICVSPGDPKLVHINACSGIYRSVNYGEKWQKLPGIPFSARRTYALLPHPTKPNVIFAGTSEGLWRATDGGKRWRLLTSKTLVIRSIVVHPTSPDRVVIATDDFGVQISDNLGDTFTDANDGFIHRHILALLPDKHERGRILASVFHDGTGGSVFLSTDGGENWQPYSRGLGARDVFAFYPSPEDNNVIYAGTNSGVFRTNDRGANWSYVGKVEAPVNVKKPVKKPARRRAALQSTSDGNLALASNFTGRAFGRYETLSVQRSNARKSQSKKPQSKARKPAPKKVEPEITEPLGPPMINLTRQVDDITSFTDAEGRRVLMAATMDGIYITRDETKGWEKIFISGYDPNGPVYAISIHPKMPKQIMVGTKQGLFASDNGGASWQPVGNGLENVIVKSIAQDPRDPNLIILGTNQFIYRSVNGGRTFVIRGGGLKAGDYTSVLFNPMDPDEVIACEYLSGGLYRSVDKGYQWERMDEQIGAQLPTTRLWTVTFDPFERGRMYAGSFSSGVYVLRLEGGTSGSN
jgi:photosystem II stability/assembly factor-like uncharacterized protein